MSQPPPQPQSDATAERLEAGSASPERHRRRQQSSAEQQDGFCRTCVRQRLLVAGATLTLVCDFSASAALAGSRPAYFLLWCLRALVLTACFLLAVKLGTGAWGCSSCSSLRLGPSGREARRRTAAMSDTVLTAPLAPASSNGSGARSGGVASPIPNGGGLAITTQLDLELDRRRAALEAQEKHSSKRNAVLAVCFVAMTAQSTYTGVHILTETSLPAFVAGSCMVVIACMNVEFVLLKRLVDRLTEEEGTLLPGVHEHPLYYQKFASMAWCKICRERIGPKTGGPEGFRCKDCDGGGGGGNFWICLGCYRKQLSKTNTEEGILRGDKGPKFVPELSTWQYLGRAVKLTHPYRCVLWMAMGAVLLTQSARVLMPNYQGNVINAIIKEDASEFSRELITFVTLSMGSLLFGSIQSLTVEVIQRRITCDIRTVMFKSLIKQDIAFFDGVMTGQLTSRMTNDVAAVVQPVRQLMNTVLSNILLLIGGLIMCLFTSWRLTVLASTMIGPVIYLTSIYAHWSRNINLRIRVNMADANAIATEALRNIRTVRSFGASDLEVSQFTRHMDEAQRSGLKDAYASAGVSAATQYIDFAATILILWYGGMTVMRKSHGWTALSVGQLITFNLYWNLLKNAITGLNGMLNTLVRAASAAQRVFEVMDLEPDIQQDAGELVLAAGQMCEVEFRGINFTYQMRPDKQVLSGLSFTIPSGNTVAIVGRSGAGKSTLVSLLLRFYDPQGGAVLINGRDLAEYRLRSYQKRVGVVSQETQIFCRPIIENLTYGLEDEAVSEEDVLQACRSANADEFIRDLDGSYKAMIGEGGVRLSGGQRQRLAIARALLRSPSLLLLDEATSALDAENEGQVQKSLDELVRRMAGRCSVMLIAHRLSTVMGADKIVVLDGGKLAEEGNHAELLERGGLYAQLVQRQLAKEKNTLSEVVEEEAPAGQKGRQKTGKGKGKFKGGSAREDAKAADSIDNLFDEVGRNNTSGQDKAAPTGDPPSGHGGGGGAGALDG